MGNVATSADSVIFQTLTVLSLLPEIICFPFGLTATDVTVNRCPKNVCFSAPEAASHILIELSLAAEITWVLSGEKHTDLTSP